MPRSTSPAAKTNSSGGSLADFLNRHSRNSEETSQADGRRSRSTERGGKKGKKGKKKYVEGDLLSDTSAVDVPPLPLVKVRRSSPGATSITSTNPTGGHHQHYSDLSDDELLTGRRGELLRVPEHRRHHRSYNMLPSTQIAPHLNGGPALYVHGRPSVTGDVVERCFPSGNGLLFRIYEHDKMRWSFYNDTIAFMMYVFYSLGPHSKVKPSERATMNRNPSTDRIEGELWVAPGRTETLLTGAVNGFKFWYSAVPKRSGESDEDLLGGPEDDEKMMSPDEMTEQWTQRQQRRNVRENLLQPMEQEAMDRELRRMQVFADSNPKERRSPTPDRGF